LITTLISAATCVSSIALFLYLYRNPNHIYYSLIFISIGTSSLILNASYSAVDEILIYSVGLSGLLRMKPRVLFKSESIESHWKLSLVFLVYLLVNTILSSSQYFEISNLRFIALYMSLILTLISIISIPQDTKRIPGVTKIAVKINLYVWVASWFILKFFGISWETQQSVTWAGTAYAAVVPAFGVFALLLIQKEKEQKIISASYGLYFFAAVMASQLYDSRVLTFSIVLSMVVITFHMKSLRKTFAIYLIFITGIITAGTLIGGSFSPSDVFKVFAGYPINYVKGASSNANFVLNPQESDLGRSKEIRCATQIVFRKSKSLEMIFGYGQNSHKYVLEQCFNSKSEVNRGAGTVRAVGFAAYLIDFGVAGLFLALLLMLMTFRKFLYEKNAPILILASLLVFSHLLVTNFLESTFLYLLLCLNYLYILLQKEKRL